MKVENNLIGNISVRTFCTVILMIGPFFIVHGYLKRIVEGGHLAEYLLGIIISIVAIVIAVIPSKETDLI